ncbi:polysaccharide deacetylase family protein [Sporosalibacterium faouarense]|uniref:polysaccharide deacetylase family protein n=1 Tax=Sporosalibacterium faouarense TaxID=516123 RepID=UPI00141CE296|nr:polysaccharide deacetylase family protein [Sporosalibacterium faouarense]MTI48045.1 DUF2334 domain-containing protein [Bacillota bacterium]
MKIIMIKNSTIYKILAVILALIVIATIVTVVNRNKAQETFKRDGDVFYKGNIDKETIALTCNVDWGNEYIPLMLDIFDENNIKITFFVTGRWAKKYPELLKEIHNRGHEIGNHGYSHKDYSKLDYASNRKQILDAHNIISETLNIEPNFFAPPSGAYNDETIKAANDLNYHMIMWSIDTIDWRNDSTSDKIINRVVSKTHNSAIVLMHPKEQTVKALPTIVQTLKNQGYEIGKVSDIVKE